MAKRTGKRASPLVEVAPEDVNTGIKPRLEAFYADPKNVSEDKKMARLIAANRSKEGTEW